MKLSASIYFIVLSLAMATLIAFQGKSDWKDILIVAVMSSPLIVNKRFYYLAFGGIAITFWLIMLSIFIGVGFYYVDADFKPRIPSLNLAGFLTILYSITGVSLFFSAVLFRVGMVERGELTPAT